MKDTINKLKREKEILIKEKENLVSQINSNISKSHEIGLKISPINNQIKAINIELNSYRDYFKYKILWDCAKAYIPIEDRDKFFSEVDKMVEEEMGYDKKL